MENLNQNEINTENNKVGDKVTYEQILNKIKSVFDDFEISSPEMVEIFNKKYKDAGVIQLLNEEGEARTDMNGNRIEPVEFEKIDENNKQAHIRGILRSLSQNPVNLTSKILQEKEMLEVLKEKGIDFEEMIKNYK